MGHASGRKHSNITNHATHHLSTKLVSLTACERRFDASNAYRAYFAQNNLSGSPAASPSPLNPAHADKTKSLRNQNVLLADMTEAQVIAKAQLGDERCFEALYVQHKRRVFSLCLRMTGNHSQAEDFTQEAFLQLFRKIGSFRGDSAFSTWLHRLSVNIVLMHFRKRVLSEISLDETLDPQQENNLKREISTRDNMLHGSTDRITLQRAIGELPPGYRIIFVLHDIEGYEHNEIAEMLGCSIGNSKSQLHKARMKLRILLAAEKPPIKGLRSTRLLAA